MLKPEPKTDQGWDFGGWGGTPRDLAQAVRQVRNLLPDATFRAAVKVLNGATQVSDEPEGLAEIPLTLRFDLIEVDIDEHRKRPDSEWNSDYYFIKLRFGRLPVWNDVRCHSPTELESRAMLEAVKEAVQPSIPRHVHFKYPNGWKALVGYVLGALVWAGVAAIVGAATATSPEVGVIVGGVFFFLTYLVTFALLGRLFPVFELYSEKPQRRRFVWGLVALVVIPMIITLIGVAVSVSKK